MAYRCILKTSYDSIRLKDSAVGNAVCCYNGSGDCSTITPGFESTTWPDISGTGWSDVYSAANNGTTANLYWCSVNTAVNTEPTSWGGAYNDGSNGGDKATGRFCYMLYKDDNGVAKKIWCTLDGCGKSGF
jgi:hypothetical protein